MSYQIRSLAPRITKTDLSKKHFEGDTWKGENIDLITIGDSFSNGAGGGKNNYYQDYLATTLNINILNIQNIGHQYNFLNTIRNLRKTKWFIQHHPKAILIESVSRELENQILCYPKNTIALPEKKLFHQIFRKNNPSYFPKPLLINTANYKAPFYYLKYNFSNRAKKEVYKFELEKKLFTASDMNHLLVYHDDLNNIDSVASIVIKLNQELNTLAKELKKDGITLIFMPVPDKYDLYYEFIKNHDRYPENPFFSLLRNLPKEYVFIDTKAILLPLLKENVQDVYYADDTHWSYKASAAITHDQHFIFLRKNN